jgi:hypothetical protein
MSINEVIKRCAGLLQVEGVASGGRIWVRIGLDQEYQKYIAYVCVLLCVRISGIGLFGEPPWIEGNIAEEQYLRRDIAWASRFARNSQLAASNSDARQGFCIVYARP